MKAYKKWTDAEIQYIKDNLEMFSDEVLAAKLSGMTGENITTSMVRRQSRGLGVVKARGRPRKNKDVPEIHQN